VNTRDTPRTDAQIRAERLAKSLRANLKRRKGQARERHNAPTGTEQTAQESTISADDSEIK
jgi:hypothetical protein